MGTFRVIRCVSYSEVYCGRLTMAWSEATENTPSFPRASLVGLAMDARSVWGLGSSEPCREAR